MMTCKAGKIIVTLTLLATTGIWLFGCGSGSDLLDENEQRYQASMSLSDADEDDVLTIDIYQNPDCDGDASTVDPEIFTDVFADITVTVSSTLTAGITLKSYRIEYIPLQTSAGNGFVDPPDLAEPEDGEYNLSIPAGSSATFTITWMNTTTKDYFYTWYLANGEVNSRYQMRVTLYFEDEFGEEREISTWRTVFLGAYDHC